MALTKYKLGSLIRKIERKNSELLYSYDDVRGVSAQKELIPTKADLVGRNISIFSIINPNEFVYNRRTTRMGERICVAYNNTDSSFILTEDYVVFSVMETSVLLPEYLFLFFNRSEFDRYARYNSWGSATELFGWDEMCNIEIELPPIDIQQKYVDIYNAMLANQKAYEQGLDDIKLTCDAYIEDLRRKTICEELRSYIEAKDERNTDLSVKLAQGICNDKYFTTPKQVADNEKSAKIVRQGQFAYNRATTRNGEKISIAFRDDVDCVVSSAYQIFEITKKDKLLPEYLLMWYMRPEFDRYARYISKGSAHEFFEYEDMEEVQIPIPDIHIQESISNIYKVYIQRKRINEQIKSQIKDICPILIKGSLQEGK